MPINPEIPCRKHPEQLLRCPICDGTVGGETTAKRHKKMLSIWGKKGGLTKKTKHKPKK